MAPLQVLTLALLATAAATHKLQGAYASTQEEPDDIIEPHVSFLETNPEEVDGMKLYEGDMLLSEEQLMEISERKFMKTDEHKWYWQDGPDGFPQVPYRFINLPDKTLNAVTTGIEKWMKKTCLNFTLTANEDQPHLRFVVKKGCYASVGRMYKQNGQDVSIGYNCEVVGMVDHEIGHAIGFQHEFCRSDRDAYVYINEDNVQSWRVGAFKKKATVDVVPYDFGSTMHYAISTFSKNGLPTITTIDPFNNYLIHYPAGLTFRDIYQVNLMYNCIGKWKTACGSNIPECKNDGYVGANCKCVCPPNTSGTKCETVTGDYYGIKDICSENVTTEGTLSSPGYPGTSRRSMQCVKVITAPANQVPQLKFTGFELYQKTPCTVGPCCAWEWIEMRNNYPKTSKSYCGTDIKPGTVFKGTAQKMVIYYYARSSFPGWQAELTFVQANPASPTTN